MLEPWNNSTLLPPPVNMFLCQKKFDVSTLTHVLNNIIKVLSKQSPLHKESAICSRFLYKYDKKFRNDIGYRNLRKVHTALKKYLSLNLLKDIESFKAALPTEHEDDLYLPTRQMLQYVMSRIMAFAKIMLRTSVCSKQSAVFYLDRIKRGERHWMSLLPYALLCRLWSMSMVLLQHSTSWYSNLYPYLNKLELKGLNFLPDNYELPEDFEQWLDLKNVDNFGRFDWAQKKNVDIDNALMDDDDNDLFENILGYVNQINKAEYVESDQEEEVIKPLLDCKQVLFPVASVKQIDHGEVLSRESFKALLNSNKNITKENNILLENNIQKESNIQKQNYFTKKQFTPPPTANSTEHSHDNVTSSNTLKTFIEKEENFRNESDTKSLTSHLSLMQWHALKNALFKLCDNPTNRKIDKKFQKIWKQKCLGYME